MPKTSGRWSTFHFSVRPSLCSTSAAVDGLLLLADPGQVVPDDSRLHRQRLDPRADQPARHVADAGVGESARHPVEECE